MDFQAETILLPGHPLFAPSTARMPTLRPWIEALLYGRRIHSRASTAVLPPEAVVSQQGHKVRNNPLPLNGYRRL